MVGDTLPKGWHWSTLGEVADPHSRSIVSGPFGSNIGSRFFVSHGIPVIRGNNLTADMRRFIDDGFVYVTNEKAKELGNCDAIVEDLVFTAAGSLGQIGIIPETARYNRYIISNKQLRARVDKLQIVPVYAFYWFASPEMVSYIQQRNTGSTVPLINLSVLRSLPIPVPPLPEQRAIAHILGTLDDKIELNRKMNATLEEMARALFKSWFVDFDPVRAKAEGRATGLPKAIADLFPSSFVDSELGEIPKGWRVKRIEEVAEKVAMGPFGSSIKVETFVDFGTPVISGQHLKSTLLTEGDYNFVTEEHATRLANANVFSGDVIFTHAGNIQNVSLIPKQSDFEKYIVSQRQFFMRCGPDMSPRYIVYYFKTPEGNHRLCANASPSGVPSLAQPVSYLKSIEIVVPTFSVLNAFDPIIKSIHEQIVVLTRESRTLASLRDTLLPKLISGELRVKDAEKIVGKVI